VIVVAEGAGQELFESGDLGKDASGNVKLHDIGAFLSQQIISYFKSRKIETTLRYFDPSYQIRSCPANTEDAVLCDRFARLAVHAGMAGKTGLMIGFLNGQFIHVPFELSIKNVKRLDLNGELWYAILSTTKQPSSFS
jgi:6-phosphofructokinase 1